MRKKILIIAPNFPPINKVSSLRPYYLALALIEQGWKVTVLANCSSDNSLARNEKGMEVIRFSSLFMAFIIILKKILTGERFYYVISTYGPSSAHILGFIAKKMFYNSVWLADYRDLWMSGNYYADVKNQKKYQIKKITEKYLLKKVDIISTVSSGLKNNLEAFHGKNVNVIYNGYEPTISKIVKEEKNSRNIQICYTGTIYSERSPVVLLEALYQELEKDKNFNTNLVIAGFVDASVKEELIKYEQLGLVSYYGKVTREAAYQLQANSDYCLIVEDYNASLQGVLTGKVFDYIGMKKPIIAIGVAKESEMAELISKAGLMAFCGQNKEDLQIFISNISRNKIFPMQCNQAFIDTLGRKSQSQKFIHLINKYKKK